MKTDRSGHEQYGCLPWRRVGDELEVMLITSRDTGRWVIPKGWPMAGKSGSEAAAQEALEEAGIEGVPGASVGFYFYDKLMKTTELRPVHVEVFALAVTDEHDDWKERRERKRVWFRTKDAADRVAERGLADLIRSFEP